MLYYTPILAKLNQLVNLANFQVIFFFSASYAQESFNLNK